MCVLLSLDILTFIVRTIIIRCVITPSWITDLVVSFRFTFENKLHASECTCTASLMFGNDRQFTKLGGGGGGHA